MRQRRGGETWPQLAKLRQDGGDTNKQQRLSWPHSEGPPRKSLSCANFSLASSLQRGAQFGAITLAERVVQLLFVASANKDERMARARAKDTRAARTRK